MARYKNGPNNTCWGIEPSLSPPKRPTAWETGIGPWIWCSEYKAERSPHLHNISGFRVVEVDLGLDPGPIGLWTSKTFHKLHRSFLRCISLLDFKRENTSIAYWRTGVQIN